MLWFKENNIKKGDPDSLKMDTDHAKRLDLMKMRKITSDESGLLNRRLKRAMTIQA
jgi:hypothetical protein